MGTMDGDFEFLPLLFLSSRYCPIAPIAVVAFCVCPALRPLHLPLALCFASGFAVVAYGFSKCAVNSLVVVFLSEYLY